MMVYVPLICLLCFLNRIKMASFGGLRYVLLNVLRYSVTIIAHRFSVVVVVIYYPAICCWCIDIQIKK